MTTAFLVLFIPLGQEAGAVVLTCLAGGVLSYIYVNDIVIFSNEGEEEEAQEEAVDVGAFIRGPGIGRDSG